MQCIYKYSNWIRRAILSIKINIQYVHTLVFVLCMIQNTHMFMLSTFLKNEMGFTYSLSINSFSFDFEF